YLVAREAFGLRSLWEAIEALDNRAAAAAQISMLLTINRTLTSAVQWLLTQVELPSKLASIITTYRNGVEQLEKWLTKRPTETDDVCKKNESLLLTQGIPAQLAHRVSSMPLLATALDLANLAEESDSDMGEIAEIFFGIGHKLGFDWLNERAHALVAETPVQREAIAVILNDLDATRRGLTASILGISDKGRKTAASRQNLDDWLTGNAAKLEHYNTLINEWRGNEVVDVSTLTLASRQLAALLS
ncbi:MAG TPA: hypothetical protein VGM36_12190, partial [Rhizomicrobium sp.]